MATHFPIRKVLSWLAGIVLVAAVAAGAGWLGWLFWPRRIPPPSVPPTPVVGLAPGGEERVWMPGRQLLGTTGVYDDELFAFLMYDYLRSRPEVKGSEVLLDYAPDAGAGTPVYRLHAMCPNSLPACGTWLAQLRSGGLAGDTRWVFVTEAELSRIRTQTRLFAKAYSGPVGAKFDRLSPARRVRYLRRFLRFKSLTDPRVRKVNPDIRTLTTEEARELAGDIITVADFYHLPLEFFLGIGAMENNYMNIRGDLTHNIWKRRADPGDIVIRRRGRRVLVRNFSVGVWQITRETLRMAHALYLADKRDYSQLPPRLRPDRALDIDRIGGPELTTYAGILLRYLLDYFHGDIAKAVGAYNGGVDKPNGKYENGVRQVADYARRILGRAAAMKDASVAAVESSSKAGS